MISMLVISRDGNQRWCLVLQKITGLFILSLLIKGHRLKTDLSTAVMLK